MLALAAARDNVAGMVDQATLSIECRRVGEGDRSWGWILSVDGQAKEESGPRFRTADEARADVTRRMDELSRLPPSSGGWT